MNTSTKAGRAALSLSYASYDSPLGVIYAVMEGLALVALSFTDESDEFEVWLSSRFGPLARFWRNNVPFSPFFSELDAYFSGREVDFKTPIKLIGTPFEQSVWRAITEIPRGSVRSYAYIASRAGSPRACRAVAGACARNMLPILIPCHRVVRSDGSIGGWSGGGGVEVKEKLLALEGVSLKRTKEVVKG